MKRAIAVPLLVLTAAAAAAAGCGGGSGAPPGVVLVSAASSLTDAFGAIGPAFEASHPGMAVQFNFGASSALVEQIKQGAPGDVFAAADEATMKKAADAGFVSGQAATFATNRLSIMVPAGNPARITGIKDLARPGVKVVLCADQVPCGRYAQEALAKVGVAMSAASEEENVKGVVSKVSLGEADAGIAYVTDVKAAGNKVEGIGIPAEFNVTADYPVAVLKDAANPDGATAFVAFLSGTDGQRILATYGFTTP